MDIPEKGRQAAHVLVDAVSVVVGVDEDVAVDAANLAYQRLADADLIDVHAEGDEDEPPVEVTVDLSNVLGGALVCMNWLVERVAQARGQSREDVVVELREFLDS